MYRSKNAHDDMIQLSHDVGYMFARFLTLLHFWPMLPDLGSDLKALGVVLKAFWRLWDVIVDTSSFVVPPPTPPHPHPTPTRIMLFVLLILYSNALCKHAPLTADYSQALFQARWRDWASALWIFSRTDATPLLLRGVLVAGMLRL